MLADALGGDCALRAWVLVTHIDPLRAYLFDGGIFESNTKHLTYWQAANEGVLGKAEVVKEEDAAYQHTALGADNEKPTPWALGRLRASLGAATTVASTTTTYMQTAAAAPCSTQHQEHLPSGRLKIFLPSTESKL
jgi:hypothetical protein